MTRREFVSTGVAGIAFAASDAHFPAHMFGRDGAIVLRKGVTPVA